MAGSHMASRLRERGARFRLAAGAVFILLTAEAAISSQQSQPREQSSDLLSHHAEFLEQAHFLLHPDERAVWEQLGENYQRDAFIRRFWRERDQTPQTARNEFQEAFEQNLVAAKERYKDLKVERARFMLAHGRPTRTFQASCEVLRRLDIWYYRGSTLFPAEFYAIFVQRGGDFRLWSQSEGLFPLAQFTSSLNDHDTVREIEARCPRGSDILQALALSPNWDNLDEGLFPEASTEWARAFLASSTTLPEDATTLEAQVTLLFPGRHQSRTIVDARIDIDSANVAVDTVEERKVARFLVDGEVLRGEELFETFRYRFDLPLAADARTIPVSVQRFLRPGTYQLNLRLQDLVAETYFREEVALVVPRVDPPPSIATEQAAEDPDPPAPTTGSEDEEDTFPTVKIFVPNDELMVGTVRVEARTSGQGIARVAFALDGRELMSKRTAPYSVTLDVGRTPQTHTLTANALDASGETLASDEILLNGGPYRFAVRLTSPLSGNTAVESVRAVAEVEVPRLEKLDRLEFYLGETLIASLYQPPFTQSIDIPKGELLSYVRAVGFLESGGAAEDIVFVNAPDLVDRFDVNFVELYTSITDRRGRPIEDLDPKSIRVFEAESSRRSSASSRPTTSPFTPVCSSTRPRPWTIV